ncbi:thioredoxin [bacterium]|nr:thioredoxin [bacterium]
MSLNLDENTFHKTISNSKGVALVDFWAPWCGPCRQQVPIVDELSEEMGDKAVIAKVNVEQEHGLAKLFNVISIPTLIVFKDGRIAEKMTGLHTKEQLKSAINNYL